MTVRVVRLGTPRIAGEGRRIATVHRPREATLEAFGVERRDNARAR